MNPNSFLNESNTLTSLLSGSPSVRRSTSRYASRLLDSSSIINTSSLLRTTIPEIDVTNTSLSSTLTNPLLVSFSQSQDATLMDEESSHETLVVGDATAETCATLYQQFLEAHHRHPLEGPFEEDSWAVIEEYSNVCCDHLNVLEELKKKRSDNINRFDSPIISDNVLKMLRLERNSWRLIRLLYLDRVNERRDDMTEDMESEVDEGIIVSDRQVVDKFFERSPSIRQMQLVIDWLEGNFAEDLQRSIDDEKIEFYSEGPHSLEHTLHQIQNSSRDVKKVSLDPDAGFRSPKDIHELDKEDENRLLRYIFRYLRAGDLQTAIELCKKLGYHWLAGVIQGWNLHHDPNLDTNSQEEGRKATEGNPQRDLFKYVCWSACETKSMSQFEKAILGSMSGNVSAILPVSVSWTDKMWAYFKASLDVQVEDEVRHHSTPKPSTARLSGSLAHNVLVRSSIELPIDYWNNKKSSVEIFRELEGLLADYNWSLEERYHFMVQKYIICNNIHALLKFMQDMIDPKKQEELSLQMDFSLSPQMTRFFAHVLLSLSITGFIGDHSSDEVKTLYRKILEIYVNFLIDNKHITLVSFYVSKLPTEYHTHCYTLLLKKITDKQERKICLEHAKRYGLDVDAITKRVVESMRETSQGNILETSCSVFDASIFLVSSTEVDASDMKLIRSLEWLSLGQIQYIEFLRQANAFMRSFVLSGKLKAAEEVYARCPSDLLQGVHRAYKKKTGSPTLSGELLNWEREHLCFNVFFQARESLSDWMRNYSESRPRQPIKPPLNSTRFTDRVAFEHRSREYEMELQQWKDNLKRQAMITAGKLYNVILFPDGGWMRDSEKMSMSSRREEGVSRTQELAALRKRFVPQLTLLLHRVLFNSSLYEECLKIADVIASDQYELHAEFTSEQLSELLQRITEASVSSLNEGLDAFGYPVTQETSSHSSN